MSGSGRLNIEIVFGDATRQELLALDVAAGTTVGAAIEASGIAARFPEHDLNVLAVGVWGRIVGRDHLLAEGDRVEIYRTLQIDPRSARRKLAAEGKSIGGGDFARKGSDPEVPDPATKDPP